MSKERVSWRVINFVTGIGGMGGGRSKQKIIVSVSHGIAIRGVSNGRKARGSPPGGEPESRRLHLFASVRTRNEANVMTSGTQLARCGEHRAEVARGSPGGHEKIIRHRFIARDKPMVVSDSFGVRFD
jgi:hypothetical protein